MLVFFVKSAANNAIARKAIMLYSLFVNWADARDKKCVVVRSEMTVVESLLRNIFLY